MRRLREIELHLILTRMVEKVGYTRPTLAARSLRKPGKAGGVEFAKALERAESVGGVDAAEGVEATQNIAAISGVGALLGAQEVSDQETRKRKSIKRGRLAIGALEQLRDALLIGTLPLSTLTRLETLVAEERGVTDDPLLNAILDEIELRAAVELAKLEVAGILPATPR